MTNNSRLEQRQPLIEKEVIKLKKQIKNFEKVSWTFVALGTFAMFYAFYLHSDYSLNDYNELGSFIGGLVGSIWSLAGLFFVYVAFLGQRQQILNQELELLYNQAELIATREELKGQKEQMIEQNKTLKQQQFENTFFNLYNRYIKALENLNQREKEGLEILDSIYDNFQIDYTRNYPIYKQGYRNKTELQILSMIFENTMKTKSKYTKPIFLDFIQILDCIDKLCKINHKYYLDLVIEQLSDKAICLIAYLGLIKEKSKIGELIRQYSIVNYVYSNSLIDQKLLSKLKINK